MCSIRIYCMISASWCVISVRWLFLCGCQSVLLDASSSSLGEHVENQMMHHHVIYTIWCIITRDHTTWSVPVLRRLHDKLFTWLSVSYLTWYIFITKGATFGEPSDALSHDMHHMMYQHTQPHRVIGVSSIERQTVCVTTRVWCFAWYIDQAGRHVENHAGHHHLVFYAPHVRHEAEPSWQSAGPPNLSGGAEYNSIAFRGSATYHVFVLEISAFKAKYILCGIHTEEPILTSWGWMA